jgi:hypothetical protein
MGKTSDKMSVYFARSPEKIRTCLRLMSGVELDTVALFFGFRRGRSKDPNLRKRIFEAWMRISCGYCGASRQADGTWRRLVPMPTEAPAPQPTSAPRPGSM